MTLGTRPLCKISLWSDKGFLLRASTLPPPTCSGTYKATRLVFWVLATSYNQALCTDFYDQYVKWCRFTKGCACWGSRKQNFTFRPHFCPKTEIFGEFLTGVIKILHQKCLHEIFIAIQPINVEMIHNDYTKYNISNYTNYITLIRTNNNNIILTIIGLI